jgi:hypothetical protein
MRCTAPLIGPLAERKIRLCYPSILWFPFNQSRLALKKASGTGSG